MEAYIFCQSCARRLDEEGALGTEKDGSKNLVYCRDCYQNGAFTHPNLTVERMSELVRAEMIARNIPQPNIDRVVANLPKLARWLGSRNSLRKQTDNRMVIAR